MALTTVKPIANMQTTETISGLPANLAPFLGSISSSLCEGVRLTVTPVDSHTTLLHLRADDHCHFGSSRGYDHPHVHVSITPCHSETAKNLHFLGFQASEFCLPVRAADTALHFDLFNRPAFERPASVLPMLIMDRVERRVLLLAPVDSFHEQVLVVPRSNTTGEEQNNDDSEKCLKWGWSGDLESVDKHFTTTLQLIVGDSPRNALRRWGQSIHQMRTLQMNSDNMNNKNNEMLPLPSSIIKGVRYSTTLLSTVSYWTDNGAAYWYRREKNHTIQQSVLKAVDGIERECGVRVGCVELDSWFYPHETTRAVSDVGYMHVVPPTGLMTWEPRPDVFNRSAFDGPAQLQQELNGRPLVLHTRHISAKSPYVMTHDAMGIDESGGNSSSNSNMQWWVDKVNGRAHPSSGNNSLWNTWAQQAVAWGAATVEHDWLVEVWQGVRQLRQRVGRVKQWLIAFADAMHAQGLSVVWCMATPADLMTVTTYMTTARTRTGSDLLHTPPAVARSSDDYRYADDPSTLWRWHLTSSVLLASLGFLPFKDVFMSYDRRFAPGYGQQEEEKQDTLKMKVSIDGDPNALLEACLSIMSAGPVGIGDRVGHHGKQAVGACARADGVLVKPDVPIQACDCSLWDFHDILWADTYSGLWGYVLGVCTAGKWGFRHKANGNDAKNSSIHSTTTTANTTISTTMTATSEDSETCSSASTYQLCESTAKHDIKLLVFDWRSCACSLVQKKKNDQNDDKILSLALGSTDAHHWKFWVVCPVFQFAHYDDGRHHSSTPCFSLIGDLDMFATMGDRRVRIVTPLPVTTAEQRDGAVVTVPGSELVFDVVGAPGEQVRVLTWNGQLCLTVVNIPAKAWTRARFICDNRSEHGGDSPVAVVQFDPECVVRSVNNPSLQQLHLQN